MIQSIRLQSLRNAEYIQLMLDVAGLVNENDPAVLKVEAKHTALQQEVNQLEELFKIAQGNIITDELIAIDTRRDNALVGIQTLINGHSYSTNAANQLAARQLELHINNFGSNIARDNYQSQTTTIRNILDDWNRQADLQAAINTLTLTDMVAELAAANTLFAERYKARAKAIGNATNESLGLRRETTNIAYYALRDRINAFWVIEEGGEPYATVTKNINGLLTNYMNLLNRRGITTDDSSEPAESADSTATA